MKIEDRIYSLSNGTRVLQPVSTIATHSGQVKHGSVFVALKGKETNGHYYLKEAIQKGAAVLVVEDKKFLEGLAFKGVVCVVENSYKILPVLLNDFYDFPSEKMFCAGVTGTNGKTTVSHILSFLFSSMGWKTGLIGTIGAKLLAAPVEKTAFLENISAANNLRDTKKREPGEKNVIPSIGNLTTPGAVELQALLNYFYEQKAQAAIMEVSSIGLDQCRTDGVDFNLGIWTNLTADHLDYHKNMESYFTSKKKLFLQSESKHFIPVLNFDDLYAVRLGGTLKNYISYGQKNAAFQWKIIQGDLSGTHFYLMHSGKKNKCYIPLPGEYNVSNAVAALAGWVAAGFPIDKGIDSLTRFPGVRGRMEHIPYKDNPVFIDYAHTPDALKSTLRFLNATKKNKQLVCVFGCGGNRDSSKRALMGAVADKFADKMILTSDNPRGEDPKKIIQSILQGIKNKDKILIEPDREQAIYKALDNKDSIILIAGKGHETTQIIGNRRLHFNDKKIIQKAIKNHKTTAKLSAARHRQPN